MQSASILRRASLAALRNPARTFAATGPFRVHVASSSVRTQLRPLSTTPPLDPSSSAAATGAAPTDSEASVKADRDEVIKIKKSVKIEEEETILPSDHHENRPHHPGRSDIDHLTDPTSTEEMVHADRHPVSKDDLLKQGQGKRSFSTSARSSADVDPDPQHLEKSGLPHLDKPTLSEEAVHADRFPENPLPGKKKSMKVEVEWDETTPPIVVKMGTQAVEPEDAVLRGDQK